MATDVNELILEEIDKSKSNEETKQFIKEIFILELKHLGQKGWKYAKEYECAAKRAAPDR